MKKINNKIYSKIGLIFGILIILSSQVLAFAVSIPHLEEDSNGNRVFYLMPGEEESMRFVVQNGGGATEEISITAAVTEGSEVIKITDATDTHIIPAGGRVDINTLITAPNDAQIGDTFNIAVGFGVGSGGSFLSQRIQQKFILVMGEEPKPQLAPEEETSKLTSKEIISNPWVMSIGAIIIIVIVWYLIKRKRK